MEQIGTHTIDGVIINLGDTLHSKRWKENGIVKDITKRGVLLKFSDKVDDYEFTYWDEISSPK